MELSAYLARAAKDFIDQSRGDTAVVDNQQFLNHLLGLGLVTWSYKNLFKCWKLLKRNQQPMMVQRLLNKF